MYFFHGFFVHFLKAVERKGLILNQKKQKDFLVAAAFWIAVLVLSFFSVRYVFALFWPFLSGLFLAFLLHPLVNWISRFSSAKKSFWSVTVLLVVYLLIGTALWFLVCFLIQGVQNVIDYLPQFYAQYIEPFLVTVSRGFSNFGGNSAGLADTLPGQTLPQQIQQSLVDLSGKALAMISGWISKAPAFFTAFLFAVLSSFMISIEYQNISSWICHNTPRSLQRILVDLKEFIFSTLFQMLKAYGILFCFTFLELALGFWLLKIPNIWGMAFIVSAADALPIIGPSIVLIPWSITQCLSGNIFQGLGLLALLGVISLIRSIIEPKIVGKQIGLHPLLTITAMYAGAQLFGIGGFLFAPIVILYFLHLKQRQNWNFALKNLF